MIRMDIRTETLCRDDMIAFAERLRRGIEGKDLLTGSGLIKVTVSFGIAVILPGGSLRSGVEEADSAMYQAKRSGRNQVCFYQADKKDTLEIDRNIW